MSRLFQIHRSSATAFVHRIVHMWFLLVSSRAVVVDYCFLCRLVKIHFIVASKPNLWNITLLVTLNVQIRMIYGRYVILCMHFLHSATSQIYHYYRFKLPIVIPFRFCVPFTSSMVLDEPLFFPQSEFWTFISNAEV